MNDELVIHHDATLLARHTIYLQPELSSAGAARRGLRAALEASDRVQWLEAAQLAATELVSNAVLHAHTRIELQIDVYEQMVHVAVRDFSPVLPVQRDYDSQATTGRGLGLVAALVTEHGISDAGRDGKTVWFVISGDPVEQSEDELLAAWADADWDLDGLDEQLSGSGGARQVTLLALPPTLWLAARQHHDALIRELVLYQAEHGEPVVDVAAADRARAVISTAVWAAVQEAQQAGTAKPAVPGGHPSALPWVPEPLDLDLHLPDELTGAFGTLQDTLDAAEQLAVHGALLCRPGLPEIIAVRDWACDQVIAQLAGVAPGPWPGTDQERFVHEVHSRDGEPVAGFDIATVRDSDRGVVAADDANRIVAVSRSLAELLGWTRDDLVGRRVVALIPPRLREAHVAGFSRHLSTGEVHVLGVPLTLPVLHADGSEVTCQFMIEEASAENGRSVYLAWIDPK